MKKWLSLALLLASVSITAWGCGGRSKPADDYQPPVKSGQSQDAGEKGPGQGL
jgi:hypothetical protein